MKKTAKLVLNRETIRRLGARDAAAVMGGVTNLCTHTSWASCPDASCGCTTGTAGVIRSSFAHPCLTTTSGL